MQTICISVDLHTFSGPVCSKVRALWKATGRRAPPPICQMSIGGWRREYGISVMPTSKNIIGSCGWNLKHSSGSHARVFSGVGGLLPWARSLSYPILSPMSPGSFLDPCLSSNGGVQGSPVLGHDTSSPYSGPWALDRPAPSSTVAGL